MLSQFYVRGNCLRKHAARIDVFRMLFNKVPICPQTTICVTQRKMFVHVLLICRRCGYSRGEMKSAMQRDFLCASNKLLHIKL